MLLHISSSWVKIRLYTENQLPRLTGSDIFLFFLMAPRYFFLHISSSWVKIRLHTENQLPRLPGSALKVPVWWVVGGWVPTHYQVKLQLMLRLSWAVTKMLDNMLS